MAEIKSSDIAKLRNETGIGIMDCKKALEESNGDSEKALECLRKKGAQVAAKRAEKEAKEGTIGFYIHNDKIGVMVEINSETDFVAKNQEFKDFAKEIAMHIAAMNPQWITTDEVPAAVLDKEKEIEMAAMTTEKKPAEIMEKIWEGKKGKFFSQCVLVKQPFVKNPDVTIEDLLNEQIAKIGEKIQIRRFVRYEIGK